MSVLCVPFVPINWIRFGAASRNSSVCPSPSTWIDVFLQKLLKDKTNERVFITVQLLAAMRNWQNKNFLFFRGTCPFTAPPPSGIRLRLDCRWNLQIVGPRFHDTVPVDFSDATSRLACCNTLVWEFPSFPLTFFAKNSTFSWNSKASLTDGDERLKILTPVPNEVDSLWLAF